MTNQNADSQVANPLMDQKLLHVEAASVPSRIRSQRNHDKNASVSAAGGLLSYDALPEYLKDNDFIRGNYRPVLGLQDSLWSLFSIHNETGNIYTHLLGVFLFVALAIYVACLPPSQTDLWPMFAFMAGAMFCYLCSTTCHLFGCCQKHIALFIWRFDYIGIAVLTVLSFYPLIYYGLLCQTSAILSYLIFESVLGVAVIAVSLLDFFQKIEWRTFRYCLFSGLGLFAIFPISHILILYYSVPQVRYAMAWEIVHGAFYLGGGAIYAARIPERY